MAKSLSEQIKTFCDSIVQKCLKPIAGAYRYTPQEIQFTLTPSSQELIQRAFEGIESSKLIDYHLHLIGTCTALTGNFIHPHFLSWRHPLLHLMALSFQSAFGIKDIKQADQEALTRLVNLVINTKQKGKYCLLALDKYYDNKGCFDPIKTKLYVSNEYIFSIAQKYQDRFIPVISLHPYRDDAIDELQKWAEQGVKIIKWLPNSMGMNPSDKRCLPFYHKMQKLGMILLSHTGFESATPLANCQEFGNPLLLRAPLEQGIKVIMAHCATLGKNKDLDDPQRKKTANFDLFLRMAQESNYRDLLFGDLAAITQINRISYLNALIEYTQPGGLLEGRIINGSDYPLPAFNILISTRVLKLMGFLDKEELKSLNEIYYYNPLLFDFVLKRTIRHSQTHQCFPSQLFMANEKLGITPCEDNHSNGLQ